MIFIASAYLIFLILLGFAPYWKSELNWLANLILILPLWPLLFLPILFVVFGFIFKKKPLLGLGFLQILILILGIMNFNIPFSLVNQINSAETLAPFRVVTLNIGEGYDQKKLGEYLRTVNPDILLIQEVHPSNHMFLNVLPKELGFHQIRNRLCVASRYPVQAGEGKPELPTTRRKGYIDKFHIRAPSGDLTIYNLHLESPRDGVEAILGRDPKGLSVMSKVTDMQLSESKLASQWVRMSPRTIVAGDFNMTVDHPMYREYWDGWGNVFIKSGFGFGYTKFTRWHGVRIDHILVAPQAKVIKASVGPDIGGDHRPVMADIAVK